VRVRTFGALQEQDPATTLKWDQLAFLRTLSDGILLEGWEEKTSWDTGLPPYPDYSALRIVRDCVGDFSTHWHLYPSPECPANRRMMGGNLGWCNIAHCTNPEATARCHASEMFQSLTCRLVVLSLIYISEGLGGLTTEVSWKPSPGAREEKTERLKPWLVPRRSTYIMIDPEKAGEYGHPSTIRPESPGHHASPVPHPRRGHWRWVSPDKRTRVRPTWVGATEWSYEGKVYRILQRPGTTA